jgi:hypothetical protein
MPIGMWTVIAEGLSDDFAFAAAKAGAPAQMGGRTMYQVLDSVFFPDDRTAFGRAEEIFGVRAQFNVASIAGQSSPTCFAIRIRPVALNHHRLIFFGVTNFASEMVTVGPKKTTHHGPDHMSTIYDGIRGM